MAFGKIAQDLKVPVGGTATYTFHSIQLCPAGPPTLTIRHAGDGNPAFRRASWHAANAARVKRAAGGAGVISEAKAKAAFLDEAKLISDHCPVSWTNVYEDDAKDPTPCTPAKVLEFLAAIIEADEGLAEYRKFSTWAQDPDVFRPAVQGDSADLGKA